VINRLVDSGSELAWSIGCRTVFAELLAWKWAGRQRPFYRISDRLFIIAKPWRTFAPQAGRTLRDGSDLLLYD